MKRRTQHIEDMLPPNRLHPILQVIRNAGTRMDCHSPESWEELWVGIFSEVDAQVKVEATVRKHIGGLSVFGTYPGNTKQRYWLDWSVTRI